MFLIKIGFFKSKVIHGLDINVSFFLVTFLRDKWLSKIALILLKNHKTNIYIFIIMINYRTLVDRKIVQYNVFLDKIRENTW